MRKINLTASQWQLGPYGFQDLAAAEAVAQFGPQVHVIGPGRDGIDSKVD
jgi:hypothetical protein